MATRSVIAKLDSKTKKIEAVYCHNDGYLEHVGTVLDSHYQDESKLDELLKHGDLSQLGNNIGEKVDFGDFEVINKNKQCVFYNRDRDEKSERRKAITLEDDIALIEFADDSCDAQFIYLYAFGAWYVYAIGKDYQFKELDDVLSKVYKY